MRGRVGYRLDNLHLPMIAPGPSMRDESLAAHFHLRPNVNEMNVRVIDLGDKCGRAFQFASPLRQL